MAMPLYDIVVPTYLQMLGSVDGLLDKAEAFCTEQNIAPGILIQTRLYEDMLPFAYQIFSAATHSKGAIEGIRKGVFSPDMTPPPTDFAGLRARVAGATQFLSDLPADEVNALEGKPMCFKMGDYQVDFVAERFLLSFSLPNFFFHVTTAYDILRMEGVKIGKVNYMGRMQKLN